MSKELLIVLHAGFTMAMAGFMVAVQLVIYPQFRSVSETEFATYVVDHSRHIVMGLALLAIPELLLALWLFVDTPETLNRSVVFVSGLLLALAWVSTAVWFAPLHGRLQQEAEQGGAGLAESITLLIRTNWFRSALWWARAGFAGWFLWRALSPSSN